jgi:hypothetical protein
MDKFKIQISKNFFAEFTSVDRDGNVEFDINYLNENDVESQYTFLNRPDIIRLIQFLAKQL